jgi:hypothetical protein
LEGVLEEVRGLEEGKGFEIALRLTGGDLVRVTEKEIIRANLVFRWGDAED